MKTFIFVLMWCCIMSVSVGSVPYGGGSGTEEDPFHVWTAEHLHALGQTPDDYDKHFILMTDISLGGTVYDRAVIAPDIDLDAWGPQGPKFTGTLDGNGFTIHDLTIRNPNADCVGLIGTAERGAVIRNLHLKNVDITGNVSVAGLAGINVGTIEHCSVTGRIEGNSIGGLVGFNDRATISNSEAVVLLTTTSPGSSGIGGLTGGNNVSVIRNSRAICTILLNHNAANVGGLAGSNWQSTIEDSYASCILKTTGSHTIKAAGGLVGENKGDIRRSAAWNTDIRVSGRAVGGLVGKNESTIALSYAMGSVSGGQSCGGLAGLNSGYIVDSYSDAVVAGQHYAGGFSGMNLYGIARSYSLSRVSVQNGQPGGFVGRNTGTVQFSYWDAETSGISAGDSGEPKTAAQLREASTFAGWGDSSWVLAEGVDRPRLIWENLPGAALRDEPAAYGGGSGTEDDPFLITTLEQLAAIGMFSQDLGKCYQLAADLDFEGQEFAGIGAGQGFSGTFDGNGHRLTRLKLSGSGQYIGLFPFIQKNGVVRNLHLQSAEAVGSRHLGLIAGKNEGLIDRCTVENAVIVCPEPEPAHTVGGLTGQNAGVIRDSLCSVRLIVESPRSQSFGGMAGHNNGRIERSVATGSIECFGRNSSFFGGMAGFCDYMSVIENCVSAVDVISRGPNSFRFGGFAGRQGYRTRVVNSLSVGKVIAGDNNHTYGGFMGINAHTSVTNDSKINGCFWDIESSGMEIGVGANPALNAAPTGATTEMLQSRHLYQEAGWSFGNEQEPGIWLIGPGMYPTPSSMAQSQMFKD